MRSRRPDSAAVPVPTHAGIAPGTAGVLTSAPRRCYWNPKVPRFTKMRQTMRPYLPQLTVPLRNRISSARLQPAPASRTPDPRFGDVPREPGEIGPTSRPGTEIAEAGARWRRAEIDVCVCNRAAQWCRLDLSLAAGWPTSAVLLLDALRGHADAAAGPCGERQSGSTAVWAMMQRCLSRTPRLLMSLRATLSSRNASSRRLSVLARTRSGWLLRRLGGVAGPSLQPH